MSTTRGSNLVQVIGKGMAAAIAISICIAQHHVCVVLSEPYTYVSPFRHKCGLLMMGCVIWAMLDVTPYLARAMSATGGHNEGRKPTS